MIFITLWSQTLVGAAQQTTKVIEEAKPIASSTVETITSADPVVIVGAAGAVFLAYLLFPSIWSAVSFGLRGYKGESAVYLFYRCFIYVKSLVWTRNVKQLNNSFHLHFDAISSSCGSLIVISDFHTWVSSSFILWAIVPGEITPAQVLDLLSTKNYIMIDIRSEKDKEKAGIPRLPSSAKNQMVSVPWVNFFIWKHTFSLCDTKH